MKQLKFPLIITLIAALVFVFSGCGEEEEPEPQSILTADAGEDQAVNVGDEVSLDGSGSSDSEGLPFEYLWSFVTIPDGSAVTFSDATIANPTFTPDVAGDYVVELTISNDESEDSDQMTIVAEENLDPVEIGGTISESTVLENRFEDPILPDYIASTNVLVNSDLTIEPGVYIIMEENVLMNISSTGTIIAEGTESDSIRFSSSNIAGGLLWQGIFVNSGSSQNILKYVELDHAGSLEMNFSGADYTAGIGVNSGGNISIENSKIHSNNGYGVYLDDDGGLLNSFSSNAIESNDIGVGMWADEVGDMDENTTFSNNSAFDVEIASSNLSENTESTWNALSGEARYRMTGNIDINGVLTINAGAKFDINEDVLIQVNGALIANGADGNMIEMTTSDDANSLLWKGIHVVSADGRNLLNYVSISYAGNSAINFAGADFESAVGVEASGRISVTNSSFSNNNGYGLYVDDGGGQLDDFADNTFENNDRAVGVPANEVDALDGNTVFSNNSQADVEIFATTYAETNESTWPDLNGNASYRVSGRLIINGDLTIAPGAIFEFDEDVVMEIYGSIIAEGTASDIITFTTSNPDGGLLWKGIYISSGSALNSFDNVDLSFAGNSPMNFAGADYAAGIGVESSGRVSVTNSVISNNFDYGLYADDGGGQIDDFSSNTFNDNAKAVGVPANEVDAIDGNTVFTNNADADVEIFGTDLAAEKIVTWNALNADASYRVTGNVDIDGELTIQPGAVLTFDEDIQLTINGALIAQGTSSDNIVFTTSNEPGALLWKGIFVLSSDNRNELDFVEVSFAGFSAHNFSGSDFQANVGVNTGAQLTITNSTITDGAGYGIYSKGTTNDFEAAAANNSFANNPLGNNYTP